MRHNMGIARDRTLLITAVDAPLWDFFGRSWAEGVKSAGISYWLVVALDEPTAAAVAAAGYGARCVLVEPPAELLAAGPRGKRSGGRKPPAGYVWQSAPWQAATWAKVAAAAVLVDRMRFDLVFSDVDVSWFADPLPALSAAAAAADSDGDGGGRTGAGEPLRRRRRVLHAAGPGRAYAAGEGPGASESEAPLRPTALFSTDMLSTANPASRRGAPADPGLEAGCGPHVNLNTGGADRGAKLSHPLYEVHWVWGGKSLESKRAAMREAGAFHDPPAHYRPQRGLMTMELRHIELPPGYNTWPASRTGDMVAFNLRALSAQLQQLYWGLAMALATNRTLVLPRFRCYCARNWYSTVACRIGGDRATTFPFTCPLSHVLRAKRLDAGGLRLYDPALGGAREADVREWPFLDNPRTAPELREAARTVLRPQRPGEQLQWEPAAGSLAAAAAAGGGPGRLGGGTGGGGASGAPLLAYVAAPADGARGWGAGATAGEVVLERRLTDRQLQQLLAAAGAAADGGSAVVAAAATAPSSTAAAGVRALAAAALLHVPDPGAVMAGFEDAALGAAFDAAMLQLAAVWCCRSAREVADSGGRLARREALGVLPPERRAGAEGEVAAEAGAL
ncbi:hypothetical protein GPECTOR_141g692 [Gonium pectorale]|uniref:Nucleotide-diphospho-sugar transferase domain-containing protein n=1 Tax=Gonium pectorale TaxID=33097 RepID=A0A150FXZ4_GONPE|nr:hypothetical protein GPECTOR_141g692 [Gonium pectorale]|eukprot:KXZ42494.1 hypothetical protein GPECTOR_141g692 [Gonium pectorale]